mmetsp:Transcript_87983/g.137886  ORF Transcript_87983/g.137886 Transcript_87983/m.137886 type:complete len:669 (-) Transcript_87983:122-2128(-)
MTEEKPASKAFNVNIGILGHIDSGKTSLCRALSTVTSTAGLDKHPQSQERGITLDLGFSSFSADAPDHFKEAGYDTLQFCLVDCPGHASLIRTVIGGAQIIDLCALVIDANKGIQTQTAECMVVAEILANQLVIILNKIDMIPAAKRAKTLVSIEKRLRQAFGKSKFSDSLTFAFTSASPQDGSDSIGIQELVEVLKGSLTVPKRDLAGPFMFSFDHAFAIKGQGTVLTGTVLSGAVKPGQNVEIPALGEAGKGKKVRSLQMFKQPVQLAGQGDRVAMCVPSLEAKELERGIVVDAKYGLPTLDACICVVNRLTYFKSEVKTKAKFHVSLGHQTVMANAYFFCPMRGRTVAESTESSTAETAERKKKAAESKTPSLAMGCGALVAERQKKWPSSFDFNIDYLHMDDLFQHGAPVEYENSDGDMVKLAAAEELGKLQFHLNGELKREISALRYDPNSGRLADQDNSPLGSTVDSKGVIPLKDRDRILYLLDWLAHESFVPGLAQVEEEPLAYALLIFEKPVLCPMGSLLIGSKLDFDIHSPNCRMAFFGRILASMNPKDLKALRLLKMKQKVGMLDRVDKQDSCLLICRDMFKADTDMSLFNGLKVSHEATGLEGILEGSYGQEGKFKVRFKQELPLSLDAKGNVKGDEQIALFFKKYDFDHGSRKIVQ